ncbi:hypothetical protein JJD41_13230 [Oxynema sp. CENA135]|uniref:hypothetical protein n=1 Tax=Oxynema sp. CENA135 TaxID=984206 RepID=UPI00190BEE68|nr:hypothetical protein [Oxynema sp. CENA135]MBK4730819.1 hypothetical protein [Oxynema sp. CENA135]
MNQLIYPNLFYFVYDLREGLGEDERELKKNQEIFASKFQETPSILERDTILETEYHELLAPQQPPIKRFPDSDRPYEGYYYPVRLNDTYGLLVACSFQETPQIHEINTILPQLKSKIDEKLTASKGVKEGTLGQTWMLLAHVPEPSAKNIKEIAKACYQQLTQQIDPQNEFDWERDLQGEGYFMGGMVFELVQYKTLLHEVPAKRSRRDRLAERSNLPTIQNLQQSHHIIIALYPNGRAAKQAAQLNFSWLRLFCYRHKILWAYGQSRYLKQQLKISYKKIKRCIDLVKQQTEPSLNLSELQKSLFDAQSTLSRYAIDLNEFADQIRTIEINLLNYQRRLKTIQENTQNKSAEALRSSTGYPPLQALVSQLDSPELNAIVGLLVNWQLSCDFTFLEKFRNDVQDKYLLQIQKDYDSLSPGLTLLEDLINSIRGITELDQAQRDRNFQAIVGVVGIGLALGALFASISGHFPTAYNDRYVIDVTTDPVWSTLLKLGVPEPWVAPSVSALISVGVSIGFIASAVIFWIFIQFLKRFIFKVSRLFKKIFY